MKIGPDQATDWKFWNHTVSHRKIYGAVCTRNYDGYSVLGTGYGVGKLYPPYTRAEP